MTIGELPAPPHFRRTGLARSGRVPYHERAREAGEWARLHNLRSADDDRFRVCLLAVDVQNSFLYPGFELYVAGSSGTGAVDDNRRLCGFIYRNLGIITQICPTMDTHRAMAESSIPSSRQTRGESIRSLHAHNRRGFGEGIWRFNRHRPKPPCPRGVRSAAPPALRQRSSGKEGKSI